MASSAPLTSATNAMKDDDKLRSKFMAVKHEIHGTNSISSRIFSTTLGFSCKSRKPNLSFTFWDWPSLKRFNGVNLQPHGFPFVISAITILGCVQ